MADGSVCNEDSFTLAGAIGATHPGCTMSTSHSPQMTDRDSLTRQIDWFLPDRQQPSSAGGNRV